MLQEAIRSYIENYFKYSRVDDTSQKIIVGAFDGSYETYRRNFEKKRNLVGNKSSKGWQNLKITLDVLELMIKIF